MNILQICSSVFLVISFYAVGYADEHFPFLAKVSKESVNIRAGANTNFEIVDKLKQGEELVILAKSFDWYKMQLPTTAKSYVRADYLKLVSNSIAELVADNVNIRAAANSDSSSLGQLKKGDLVKLIVQTNGWWQIEPPSKAVGWIRKDFVDLKSLTVDQHLMRGPVTIPTIQSKTTVLAATDIKGKLVSLAEPKADIRYMLLINGKVAYYVQGSPQMERFKGAMVLIKGVIIADNDHRYDFPVLRIINIFSSLIMVLDIVLLLFFAVLPAIVLHECAHGLVAYWMGDSTAKDGGRLTLNPIKHIDLVGSIIVPGALFLLQAPIFLGWAKPVPVNFSRMKNIRLGLILVAIAGPLTNVGIAYLFINLYKLGFLSNWAHIWQWAILFNIALCVFNLLPIPPLDGSRILTGILPRQIAYQYSRLEPFGMIIVLILLQFGMLRFLYPLMSLLGDWLGIQL